MGDRENPIQNEQGGSGKGRQKKTRRGGLLSAPRHERRWCAIDLLIALVLLGLLSGLSLTGLLLVLMLASFLLVLLAGGLLLSGLVGLVRLILCHGDTPVSVRSAPLRMIRLRLKWLG